MNYMALSSIHRHPAAVGNDLEVAWEDEQEAIDGFLKGIEELGVQSLATKLNSIYGVRRRWW